MLDPFIGTIVAWPINFAPVDWLFCEGQTLNVNQYQALYSLIGNTYGGTPGVTFCLPDLRGAVVVGANYNATPGPVFQVGQKVGNFEVNAILPAHTHTMPQTGMSVDLSKGTVNASAAEMTVNATGSYGLPLSAETTNGSGVPSTSDRYLGTTRQVTGAALNSFYKSDTQPTVTTAPTPISVSGKATPSVSASMSGNVNVTVEPNTVVSTQGVPNAKIPVMQPGLVLRYIIAVNGIYPQRP